jgi:hypothetical protein
MGCVDCVVSEASPSHGLPSHRQRASSHLVSHHVFAVGVCPAAQVVATHLPPEEIEGIRQMFMDLDADGSGTISFEELREGAGQAAACRKLKCARCTLLWPMATV